MAYTNIEQRTLAEEFEKLKPFYDHLLWACKSSLILTKCGVTALKLNKSVETNSLLGVDPMFFIVPLTHNFAVTHCCNRT
jgi:hypothetical protein